MAIVSSVDLLANWCGSRVGGETGFDVSQNQFLQAHTLMTADECYGAEVIVGDFLGMIMADF